MNQTLYRKTPLMGWASWNAYRTNISEEILKKQADALISSGLADAGYTYFNIDDGYFGGRGENGSLQTHPKRFPNGMRVLSDYVHNLGLKAGIYTEAGDNTCGFYYDAEGRNGEGVGLYGNEEQDLRQLLIEWNFDFIKVDFCGGVRMGLDEKEQYTKIGAIIDRIRQEENSCIVYNVCRWQFPGSWVAKIADSWRTGVDINPHFDSVIYQLDMIKDLQSYCSPGHVNDLDMMQVGNGMTREEDEAHFAMWCMMSTPLMLGCDLTKLGQETLNIVTNRELIDINQDPACQQGYVAKEFRSGENLEAEIWIKNLGKTLSEKKAAAFLNRSTKPVTMQATLEELGLKGNPSEVILRDLIRHEDLQWKDLCKDGILEITVPPHSVRIFRITACEAVFVENKATPPRDYEESEHRITLEQAFEWKKEGAVLVDVRFDGEDLPKLEGTMHIPGWDLHDQTKSAFPDKDERIVMICNSGKRSNHAARELFYKGYRNVFFTSIF